MYQKYKLIIKKKKTMHDEIVLSTKANLDFMKGLISRSLINSYISLYDFDLINDVLKNMMIWEKKSKF